MTALALLIKDHNKSVARPDVLLDVVSVTTRRMLEMGQKGEIPWLDHEPTGGHGIFGSNMQHIFAVRQINFGYSENRCRVFSFPVMKHSIHVFQANPIRHRDGTWDDREGTLHAMFLVDEGYGKRVRDFVQEELDTWVLEDGRKPSRAKL